MKCNNPYEFMSGEGHYHLIPCGRCHACRVNKRIEWTDRIIHEIGKGDGTFLTLTYDDEHLPIDKSVNKDDLQKFFKRIRKHLNNERKIKYYAVGEYGGKFGRCHYHAIVTNTHFRQDLELFQKCWTKGFITSLPAVPADIRYTLKYMEKEQHQKDKIYFVDGMEVAPPFSIMSKGLGLDWILVNREQIIALDGYPRNGHIQSLPRYYRNKLGLSSANTQIDKKVLDYMKEHDLSYFQAIQRLGKQAELDALKKEFYQKK